MCLNPCCNGRCTRTHCGIYYNENQLRLNPCCNGRCTRTAKSVFDIELFGVLILVVMEDALVQGTTDHILFITLES